MILAFVIVLSIIGIALSLSMYANILPFIGTLGDIKEYNMAYYGAQSSLERSLLVLRYQGPGFNGEGGHIASSNVGPVSDLGSGFGAFTNSSNELYWKIIGRSTLVPLSGLGNTESAFLSGTDNDFNILDYNSLNKIELGYDSTSVVNSYADDSSFVNSSGIVVSAVLRLNPVIYENFEDGGLGDGDLCDSCDGDGDGVSDDVAVDRGWKGNYDDGGISGTFSIFPYQDVYYTNGIGTVQSLDQAVRESLINDPEQEILVFGAGGDLFNPLNPVFGMSDDTQHLMITDNDNLSGLSFEQLLNSSSPLLTSQAISLGLVNPLVTSLGSVYPFLEYKIECSGCGNLDGESQLSQPYFYITAQSKVGNYDVKMQIIRSAHQDAFVSSFTVIF